MSEERSFRFRRLADAVHGQHDGAGDGLPEGEAGVGAQYRRSEVHAHGDEGIGFVAFEHPLQQSLFLEQSRPTTKRTTTMIPGR